MVLMVDGGRNSRHILQEGWLEAKQATLASGGKGRADTQVPTDSLAKALAKRSVPPAAERALQAAMVQLPVARETQV